MLDRRQLLDRAVDEAREVRAQILGAVDRAVQQFAEVRHVGAGLEFAEALVLHEVAFDLGKAVSAHEPLVQPLQRKLACAPPCAAPTAGALLGVRVPCHRRPW